MRPLVRPVVARRVCLFLRRDLAPSPSAAAFRDFLRGYVKAGGYPGGATASAVKRP